MKNNGSYILLCTCIPFIKNKILEIVTFLLDENISLD